MRNATQAAIADFNEHGEAKRAVVMFHLHNANGLRVFTAGKIPESLRAASGQVHFADGTWVADGSILAGEGAEVLLGFHDWVVDGGAFTQGSSPSASPIDGFREREAPALTLTLSNAQDEDGYHRMSRILAAEPVVGGQLDVRAGFRGATLGDVLLLASFKVERVIEKFSEVVLECEGT